VPFPKKRRRSYAWLVAPALAALLVYALWPAAVPVETARAERGALRVTVDEEGETRAQDRFVVAAPVPGRLLRIALEEGDAVTRDQVVATIEPSPLSQREREEVLARVTAAEAARRQAEARLAHARADYEMAQTERQRGEQLARNGVISKQALDQVRTAERSASEELKAAQYAVQVAAAEIKVARAGLVGLEKQGEAQKPVAVRSPVAGRVLHVTEESERVVGAGMPLLVLGDPKKIEVVVDVLSTDAVKIKPGAEMLLEGWGGEHPLRAKVRLVEPAGFTKISALGVEEKRVHVIGDFVDAPGPLGDAYRVEARIVVWAGEGVLKVPASAVFRKGEAWSTFTVEGGRARLRGIEIGHRSETEVEVLRGIEDGAEVIAHPPNQVRDRVRVRALSSLPRGNR